MGRTYEEIDERWRDWIARQPMFFVATAPLAGGGHVNVSPKGPIGTLRVLDGHTVAYLDVVGSGAETIAHLRENGRIVIMVCAFSGPPRIVRFHGRGVVLRWDEPGFSEYLERCAFENLSIPEAARSIITIDVERVSDSCGYGVPLMEFQGLREHHALSTAKQLRRLGPDGLQEHKRTKNARSLDGLPAVS